MIAAATYIKLLQTKLYSQQTTTLSESIESIKQPKMKWTIATISLFIACISAASASALDKPDFHSSGAMPGYSSTNRGEYYKTLSQKSDNCDPEAALDFEIDTSPRKYSYFEVTSPMKIFDVREKSVHQDGKIAVTYTVKGHHGKCQLDVTIYVAPE